MKLLTEVKSTTWPGDTFYRNSDGQQCSVPGRPFTTYRIEGCEEELQHDAMAAHAQKKAEREADALFGPDTRWYRARAWINTRAAEILAGWLGEE